MISNLITMNGYGIFVWSSFVITILVCWLVYYKTKKTLKQCLYETQIYITKRPETSKLCEE